MRRVPKQKTYKDAEDKFFRIILAIWAVVLILGLSTIGVVLWAIVRIVNANT